MQKILVIDSNEQLGAEIKKIAHQYIPHDFFFYDYPDIDITQAEAVEQIVKTNKITAIINCATYIVVDWSEDEKEKAIQINQRGPEILATIAKKRDIRFIHISTDYVFDGKNHRPYTEKDRTKPIGVYGRTKFAGEEQVLKYCPKSVIIRTSWLYSSFGNNFVKTIMHLMKYQNKIGIISDQVGTPTYAADLAVVCLTVITDRKFYSKTGIYHFSNEGGASWYDLAIAIRNFCGLICKINPLGTDEYPTKQQRPRYSVLDKTKIKSKWNISVPYWRDSLERCLEQLTIKRD